MSHVIYLNKIFNYIIIKLSCINDLSQCYFFISEWYGTRSWFSRVSKWMWWDYIWKRLKRMCFIYCLEVIVLQEQCFFLFFSVRLGRRSRPKNTIYLIENVIRYTAYSVPRKGALQNAFCFSHQWQWVNVTTV